MKKVILPLILLFVGVSLVALESAPSDVVGFVKISCSGGTAGNGSYTPFAVPFTCYDASIVETLALADIVGPYMTGGWFGTGDEVMDIGAGQVSAKAVDGTFSGTIPNQEFTLGHAYYMISYNGAFDMYLAGKVDPETIDFGLMDTGYNVVGIKCASELHLDETDLLAAGFTSGWFGTGDELIDMNTGSVASHNGTNWTGFTTLTPGHCYYVRVLDTNTPFNWVFDPASRSASSNPTIQNRNNKMTRR